jgi:hypothetical protein
MERMTSWSLRAALVTIAAAGAFAAFAHRAGEGPGRATPLLFAAKRT